jgi:hypothetical protein
LEIVVLTFTLRLKQFSSHITRNFQGLNHGAALSDKARNILGYGQINLFKKPFNMQIGNFLLDDFSSVQCSLSLYVWSY